MKLIKDILTGKDGETYDSGRVLCLVSFLVYFALAFIGASDGEPWTALNFASGAGTMAVGFGINLKVKQSTEPDHK